MLVLSETEIRARVIGTMSLLSPVCIVCCVCVWVVSRDVISVNVMWHGKVHVDCVRKIYNLLQ